MHSKLIRLIALLLLWTQTGFSHTLTLLTEEYPPYNYLENDKVTGLNQKILERLCADTNMECSFELMAWSRAFSLALDNTHTGVFSTSKTSDRESKFYWVGPLETANLNLYALKENTNVSGDTLADLSKFSVGVVRGSLTRSILMDNGWNQPDNIVAFSSFDDFYVPFLNGRYELLPASDLSLGHSLKKLDFSANGVRIVYRFKENAYSHYLALNKGTPVATVEQLNNALKSLRKSGWIATLRKQYELH